MSRQVQRVDLPNLVLSLRHTSGLLAHPCRCSSDCTIGDHVWRSTKDMAPGVRAQNTDPKTRGSHSDTDEPDDQAQDTPDDWLLGDSSDPTASLHDRYVELLTASRDADQALAKFLQAHRPDRKVPLDDVASDTDWCRNHLQTLGVCVPRYRGDACRDCYEFHQAYRLDAPIDLLQAKRDGKRWTQRMVDDAVRTARRAARARRRNKGAA